MNLRRLCWAPQSWPWRSCRSPAGTFTAAVEVYAFARGVHAGIWANVALRGAVIALFIRYGLRQKEDNRDH